MTNDIVTFRNADGTQISNDPRFHARGLAKQMADQQRALEQFRTAQGQSQVPPADPSAPNVGDEDSSPADDEANPPLVNYSEWTGKQLKAEAKRRELDIAGLTKKSEFVALLEADDPDDDDEETEEPEGSEDEGSDNEE